MKLDTFKDYWKERNMSQDEFYKSVSLTGKELRDIQNYIKALQDKNAPSSIIISHLQKFSPKLQEKWRAERAYFTEMKSMESKLVIESGEELNVTKYRVILSPSACELCRKKTVNGKKKFNSDDVKKGGGDAPPYHPNCYCALLPE